MSFEHAASGVLAAFIASIVAKWYANAKAYREHKEWEAAWKAYAAQQQQQQQRK